MQEKKKKNKIKTHGLKAKMLTMFILMFNVLILLVSITIALVYINWNIRHTEQKAFSLAAVVAASVDGDLVEHYRDTLTKDEEYEEIQEYLDKIRMRALAKYLYICIPEENGYRYIWDAANPSADDGVMDLGDFDEYYGEGGKVMPGVLQNAGHGKYEDSVLVTNHHIYGFVVSAFFPIKNSSGEAIALASVDIAMEDVAYDAMLLALATGGVMIIVMLVFCIIFYRRMNRQVVRPIHKLNDVISEYVSGKMQEGKVMECEIRTGDEIEELADSFSKMSVELKDYMENFTAVTKEKERIGAELNVAQKIQEDMLPRIFPPYPERKDFDVYASMDPAKEVGGDFYDLFLVDENHIALTVADVSGKGVPAALFMVITKTLLKNRTMMGGAPSQIVADVNNQLCEGNEAEYFVTLWFAIVDLTTGDGIAVNAGHEHPILKKKDGDYVLIKYRHSPPIGTMPDLSFEQRRFWMEPGDLLFVYTDGVPEAMNANEELYGTDRLIGVLNQNKDAGPEELLPAVKDDIDAYVGAAPQFDDLTMLAFRLNGT
ncbi:MAG: SpoIIE family protein phosphatase [Lachnospiraceae bacterium]|nr:SpoIIE family protein phosphatase [Lachnospiraceae bacterium]